MIKRILGFLVSLMLLFTAVPVGAEFIDVYGTKYENAVQLLSDIGIMEGVSGSHFEPFAQVKRADAARYVAALSGVSEVGAAQLYTDIPEGHPAFGAVFVASQLGIVSGVSDGLFNPDGFVSGEQVAKMLVVLAGYQPHAEALGGYPGGYLAKANELDILKGVSIAEPFTKGELALMLYNTLSVKPAEKASYGTDAGAYVASEETLLAKNLHIYKVRGQVTANDVTAVRGTIVRKNEVAIEGEAYLASPDFAQKIGRQVIAYYKKNEQGVKEIISFTDAFEDTSSVTLVSKDIRPETSAGALVYQRENEDKATTVALSADTVVILNGAVLTPVTAKDLQPAQGSVYVTEGNNGTASVIVIEEYADFVVEDSNPDEGVIFYRDNALEETGLNFADSKVRFTAFDNAGNLYDFQSATAGTVLSVMKSRDGKLCTVIACKDKAEGVITEKTDEAVYIDGKAYTFSASYNDVIPSLGENVSLSLNYKGEVVGNEANFSARRYGYLMFGTYEGKGLSKVSKVKILTSDNEIKIFSAAENVLVNGLAVKNDLLFNKDAELNADQLEAVSAIYMDGKTMEQLVVYEVNAAGEITSIQTAEDRTAVFERDRNIFSLQYEADTDMFLAYGLRMFSSKYRMTTDALVFSVGQKYDGSNDEQYKAMKGDALQHVGHYPGLKLYDMNEENEAAVMVTKLNMSDDTKTYISNAVLVKSVGMAATEDGEVCESLRIVGAGGTETTLYNPDEVLAVFGATAISDPETDPAALYNPDNEAMELPSHIALSKLHPGDVIKYSAVDGVLTSVIVCFRVGSPKELEIAYEGKTRKYPSAGNDYYQGLWVYGKALYAGANGFRFYALNHSGVPRERIHTYGSATVLIFDKDRQTITVGKPASLARGDAFFASRMNAAEHLLVIYR